MEDDKNALDVSPNAYQYTDISDSVPDFEKCETSPPIH